MKKAQGELKVGIDLNSLDCRVEKHMHQAKCSKEMQYFRASSDLPSIELRFTSIKLSWMKMYYKRQIYLCVRENLNASFACGDWLESIAFVTRPG